MSSKLNSLSQHPLQPALRALLKAPNQQKHNLNLLALLKQWQHNIQTRRQLAALPEYLLKDIGLSYADRQAELKKPFWQN